MAEYNIPGVYSEIDASAAVSSPGNTQNVIGIVAKGDTGTDNQAYAPASFNDAEARYGKGTNIANLMEIAMRNGASKFIIVKVAEDGGTPGEFLYEDALAVLALEEAVNIVLTDIEDSTGHEILKAHCLEASANRKERIAIIGNAVSADMSSVNTGAGTLNSGRVFSVYPNPLDASGDEISGIYAAAALAGQIAAETDPSMPMTNVELKGFFGLSKKLTDDEMNTMILAGVIPLESNNGKITVVRAVSTYTKDEEGNNDITWQELTTTTISDFIFKDLRSRLSKKYGRAKQNQKTRDALKSEMMSGLFDYERLEYLEEVQANDASVAVNPANPTRNDIRFKYNVVTPLNVIHLTGHLVL